MNRKENLMSNFEVYDDLEIMRELLGLTIEALAEKIGVTSMTIRRWRTNEDQISAPNLKSIYELAFSKGIRLNKIKEQLFREECTDANKVILFHGAKNCIEGELSIEKSKKGNDFGKGFYCGESLEQSAMFVANYPDSSLYIMEFDRSDLNFVKLNVDRDWMLMIAYFRNKLGDYGKHPIVINLLDKLKNIDYIIAPIADNRMFEIIDSFIDGEITDIQCQHCLSATNLGNQYVFVTQKALDRVKILRHCYLTQAEKKYYLSSRQDEAKISNDKVKIARKMYRGQGEYIEDILK